MTLRNLSIFILCCTSLFSSGCATVVTNYFPIKITETKQGEKVIDTRVGYNYSLKETKDSLVLLRQPLCSQKIKLITMEKNMVHGDVFALLEIPILGLGFLDMSMAEAASKATEKESDGGTIKSSEIIACGTIDPGANIELILGFPESISLSRVKTDDQGKIPFSAINNLSKKDSQYIVFVKEKDGVSYVQTVERKDITSILNQR